MDAGRRVRCEPYGGLLMHYKGEMGAERLMRYDLPYGVG